MARNPLTQGIGRVVLLYPFTLVSLLLSFFFYFNGAVLFPEFEELDLDKWILAYIVFQVAALAFARKQLSQLPLPFEAMWLTVGFIVSWALFSALFAAQKVEQPFIVTGAMWSVVAFQFVVATSEESAFRGIFVRYVKGSPIATYATVIIGALAFAAFHFAAYTQTGTGMLGFVWPFVFGALMGYLFLKVKSIGLLIGIHWAYNLALIGVALF